MNTNLENILRISYTSQIKPNSTKPNQTNTNPSLVQAMPDKILEKFEDKGKNQNNSAKFFFLAKMRNFGEHLVGTCKKSLYILTTLWVDLRYFKLWNLLDQISKVYTIRLQLLWTFFSQKYSFPENSNIFGKVHIFKLF